MSIDIKQHELRVAELRKQLVPSTQLVDVLNELAQALSQSDIQRALEVSKEAHKLAYLLHHHLGMAISLARLGWLNLEIGAFETALLQAHEAQFLAEHMHDYVLITRSVHVIAAAQLMAGNFAKAEKLWLRLAQLAQSNNDLPRQADALSSLGRMFEVQRDFDRSLEYYRQGHDIYFELADINHILAKNNMAYALTMRSRHLDALELAEQALRLCDPEWQVWRALFLNTLGATHAHLQRYDLARSEFGESLTLSLSPAGRKTSAVEALLGIARVEVVQNRMPAAYDKLERAIALAAEIKSVPQQIEAHKILFRLYQLAHNQEHADQHHEAYLALQNQIALERIERHASVMRIEVEAEKRRSVWLHDSQEITLGSYILNPHSRPS